MDGLSGLSNQARERSVFGVVIGIEGLIKGEAGAQIGWR